MKSYASRIESYILKRQDTSRKELAELTGLSLSSISSYVARLIKDEVLLEGQVKKKSGMSGAVGRPSLPLTLNPSLCFALGCEVKHDRILTEITDVRGGRRNFLEFRGGIRDEADLMALVEKAIRRAISKAPYPERVSSIGVCLSGSVNYNRGLIVHSPAVGNIRNFPLKENLEELFSLPVIVENDARSMGFAEVHFSPASDYRNTVFINIGKSIGSAIIMGGKLFRGGRDMGGEIGHVSILSGKEAPMCSCGNRGCLQTLASCSAMLRRAEELLDEGVISTLDERRGKSGRLEFIHLAEAAEAGDSAALIVFEEAAEYLAAGIGNVLNLLNPELVVIGGEIVGAKEYFKGVIPGLLKTRAISEVAENVKIEFSSLGQDEAAYGAALLAMEKVSIIPRGNGGYRI